MSSPCHSRMISSSVPKTACGRGGVAEIQGDKRLGPRLLTVDQLLHVPGTL
jgi:hypothetical protein